MPRTSDPDRYPTDFFALLHRASEGEVVSIPVETPSQAPGLRGYIQAFLRACETRPDLKEKAKALAVTVQKDATGTPFAVQVASRSQGLFASLVRGALGTPSIEDAAAAAQKRLVDSMSTFPL